MPLTGSQLRIIIVIVVTCILINVLLYSTAVFTATRTGPLDNSLEGSKLNYVAENYADDYVSSSLRFNSHGKRYSNYKTPKRKWKAKTPGKSRSFASSAGEEDWGKDWLEEDEEYSRTMPESWNSSSSELRHVNGTKSKQIHTKSRTPSRIRASEDFNIERAVHLFEGCIASDDQIYIDCFNDAYEELSKMFKPLGTVFSFVTSEIQEKINILRQYRKHLTHGKHFHTVQSMVQYEMDHKLTVQDDNPSGSRTFLRMHWALQFISALVRKILVTQDNSKFHDEACKAYDQTLAQHHPWLMQKAVHFALYALPERPDLLVKLHIRGTPAEMAQVKALVTQLDAIYRICQDLYARNRLLDLP